LFLSFVEASRSIPVGGGNAPQAGLPTTKKKITKEEERRRKHHASAYLQWLKKQTQRSEMGAFYCSICGKTDFSGKGHIHGKSHQSKLKVILVKFMDKVSVLLTKQLLAYSGSKYDLGT